MSNSESKNSQIQIEDLCTEKKYFTQIPNIIHRMGLGPYVVAYYCLLKSIAGETGSCFTGQKKLAATLGCSDRQIRKMNKFMSQPFEILGGKPLIKVSYRKNDEGECLPNLIHVVDIWVENVMVLSSKKPIPQTPIRKTEQIIKEIIQEELRSPTPEPNSPPPAPRSDKEEPRSNNPGINISLLDLGKKYEKIIKPKKKNLACHKNDGKTLDVRIRWRMNEDQAETFLALKTMDINANDNKLSYWAKTHSLQRLIEVYHEAKAYNPNSMRAYMGKLLDQDKAVPKAHSQMNKEFAADYIKANKWFGPKLFKNYLKIPLNGDFIEIEFNLTPLDFANRLIEKHQTTNRN